MADDPGFLTPIRKKSAIMPTVPEKRIEKSNIDFNLLYNYFFLYPFYDNIVSEKSTNINSYFLSIGEETKVLHIDPLSLNIKESLIPGRKRSDRINYSKFYKRINSGSDILKTAIYDNEKENIINNTEVLNKIKSDLELDDNKVLAITNEINQNDEDFLLDTEMKSIGVAMEFFICAHFVCPVCKQKTLKKYSHPNMPVIDLICINEIHQTENTCCFWQVKTKRNDSSYFTDEYINVGSYKIGSHAHCIKSNVLSLIIKQIIPGYICIVLREDKQIDMDKSFYLIPNLQKSNDEYYYEYIDKNKIKWNSGLVNKTRIGEIEIGFNYETKYFCIENKTNLTKVSIYKSLFLEGGFLNSDQIYYLKYLKYKNKYLQLISKTNPSK